MTSAVFAPPHGLYTSSRDGSLQCWTVDEGGRATLLGQVPVAHHDWVNALALSPRGKLLASAGNDMRIKVRWVMGWG